jgi:O-antigen/teichoic acid export membrane protein
MRGPLCIFLGQVPVRVATFKKRFSGTDISSRLVRGTFWASIGALVSRLFALVASIIIVRLLGKEGYGVMGMVYSTMGMFGVFAGFGLGSAATKYIAEFRLTDSLRTGRILTLVTLTSLITGGVMLIIAFLLSPWLAFHTLNRPDIAPLLQAGALLLFISTVTGVQQGVLAGFESFQKSAKINLYQGIASPFITVPFVWIYGVQGAIASYTVNTALTLILSAVAVRGEIKINRIQLTEPLHFCWSEHLILTRFAIPALFSSSLIGPVTWLTNTMLVNRAGGYGELGLFNAANQWRQVIMFLPALLSSAMLPILAQTHGQEDKADYKRIVAINLKMIWVIALPVTVLMMTLGKPLTSLFGRQFTGAAPIISVLMVSCFLNVVNGPVGSALTGAGKMWTGTMMNLGWAVALVLSTMALIPSLGGLGLALSYLFAYLLHSVWQMTYVEIKLAPQTIRTQWGLFLLSGVLLTASMWVGVKDFHQFLFGIPLVVCSVLPSVSFFRTKWKSTGGITTMATKTI